MKENRYGLSKIFKKFVHQRSDRFLHQDDGFRKIKINILNELKNHIVLFLRSIWKNLTNFQWMPQNNLEKL